jgi:hypothetical protein
MRSNNTRVHIVVTCANRKRLPVPAHIRMRKVAGARVSTRLRAWVQRLSENSASEVPAEQLYAGEHWDVARSLTECVAEPASLWVASAGYGLIPATTSIKPYSATFSPGHADSVVNVRGDVGAWWRGLANWEGPSGEARTLTNLVQQHPDLRLILVLSDPYLRACMDDITSAAASLKDPTQLSIICAGAKPVAAIKEHLLPSDARLQHSLGGTLQALNVRFAAHLLAGGSLSHSAMKRRALAMLRKQPPLPVYSRTRMSDAQVRQFIRTRSRMVETPSHTRLLRELRTAGLACEQGRFAGLFHAELGART